MESVKISPKKCEIAMALAGHHSGLTTAPPLLDTKGKKLARFVDEGITNNQSHSLRASSPIWASEAKNARARGRGKESLQQTPGGDSHMKQTGMLVVSLRGVNFGFWSRLGCSGQSTNILSRQGLV